MEYGCIGKKLGHSFSKDIHALLADYKYELAEIPEDSLSDFMKKADFKAINVTIPYKEKVIPFLSYISPEAEAIGAVNTIVNNGGRLSGYNTDFAGMRSLILKTGIDPEGKTALILGTGGTSRTAAAVLKSLGAKEIKRVSRSGKDGALTYDEAYENYSGAEIIVNTTPAGMYPDTEGVSVDIERFPHLTGVIDAVYNPLRTNLILSAKKRGIKASGGLYMLVAQAFYAYRYFTGDEGDGRVINKIYKKILSEKENIVLTGMPGSGKTTLGKIIAKKTGKAFYDTDDEIKNMFSSSPDEIIASEGEAAFREKETAAVKKLSGLTGAVIATGGGAVLKEENITALKRNGKVVFIDRPIEFIKPTADRPLSCDMEKLSARYNERYPIYLGTADIKIVPGIDRKRNAEKIIRSVSGEDTGN